MVNPITEAVYRRFLAFKYQPKESKQSKVDRLMKLIREKTGIGRGPAEDIADAVIRNRDLERLALQKRWPMQDGVIEGPAGTMSVSEVQAQLGRVIQASGDRYRYQREWPHLGIESTAIQSSMARWQELPVVHLSGRTDRVRDLLDKTDAKRVRRSWVMSTETADKLFEELDARERVGVA